MTKPVVLALLACTFMTGCVAVQPWERERLARGVMSRAGDVGEAMVERTFLESREGSTGGYAVGAGGGCACN